MVFSLSDRIKNTCECIPQRLNTPKQNISEEKFFRKKSDNIAVKMHVVMFNCKTKNAVKTMWLQCEWTLKTELTDRTAVSLNDGTPRTSKTKGFYTPPNSTSQ